MKNQCSFAIGSTKGFPRKWHVRSTCWKLKSHASLEDFEGLTSKASPRNTRETFCLEDF